MAASSRAAVPGWRKFAVLFLGIAVVGLPINHLGGYVLLAIFAVVVFSGEVSGRPRAWLTALAIVAIVAIGQLLLAPPRIEEGHNVFLPGGSGALERDLPPDVYRFMANEFDAVYPPAVRCAAASAGCWQNQGFPDKAFAFSADGIWHKSAASRGVAALDFSDPVWLRLGFVNELRYNWLTTKPDVHRADRDRRFWMGLHRWHLAMPWFEMLRLPAAYVGGKLCWRGDVLFENAGGTFAALPALGCRAIEATDGGRRVFGVAIKPDTLAMSLEPPWSVRLRHLAATALLLAGLIGLLAVLVRVRVPRIIPPLLLIGLSVIVIAVDDASFLGGVRPFDGGDDGMFYDSVGRVILRDFLDGNFYDALRGGESVFYYGGPGLRYFFALEHLIFGESHLGYLSLMLLLPFLVYFLFARFLPQRWAIGLTAVFVAIPLGLLFGTSFINYAGWAARGFADPLAYMLFVAGTVVVIGATSAGPCDRFTSAVFGALLLALGICMKPIVAPAAAVLLGCSGLATLYLRQFRRLAGLCLGFSPVFLMALHNWVYGHVFVLFSANSEHPLVLVMPPSAWAAAAHEVLSFDLHGTKLALAAKQILDWLSGPAESHWTIPLNGLAVIVLIYVVARGRRFDPWLRVVGAAALAQHVVALFYTSAVARYHFLEWLLTAVVVMVWFHQIGIDWLNRRYPALATRMAANSTRMRLASGLAHLQKMTA